MGFARSPVIIATIRICCGSTRTNTESTISRLNRRRGCLAGTRTGAGPVWFPTNFLIIEALQKFHYFLGDDFQVECPSGSGHWTDLWQVSLELQRRLTRLFLLDDRGRRPVFGSIEKFQVIPTGAIT